MCILDTEYYYRINNKDKGEERERERITRLLRYNNIVDGSCYIESSIDKFLLETILATRLFTFPPGVSLASLFFLERHEIQSFSKLRNSFEIANIRHPRVRHPRSLNNCYRETKKLFRQLHASFTYRK